jgi:PGF-CTERM protein
VKKKKMNTKMKSKRGKAIIGIAMAAIMVASVMVAMVPTATAVAPTVTVDKLWDVVDSTSLTPWATYTFEITNEGAAADTFAVTYALPAGWVGAPASGVVTALINPGVPTPFVLTITPPALPTTPTFAATPVTFTATSDLAFITLPPVTTYVVNGRYNAIEYQPLASATSPAQPVQIGQHLDFTGAGWGAFGINAEIKGDPRSDTVQGELFFSDSTGHFDTPVMTKTGTYYVNPTGTGPVGEPTAWDAQLGVATPTMTVELKVESNSVSSITEGSALEVDFMNTLDAADLVSLVITDPSGDVIKSDELPAGGYQVFDKISTGYLTGTYGVGNAGIDTTGWSLGTYTFKVKTKHANARGLEMTSNEKTLTMVKSEITISAETTTIAEDETVRLTVTGVNDHNIRIASNSPGDTLFPGGLDDNKKTDTTGFDDTIDFDGKRTYAVQFSDTGSFIITVSDMSLPLPWPTDTVDITVEEKAVTFDMPGTVMIGEKLEIKGTSNTGDWVAVAFDDMIPQGYDKLVIGADNEFSKDINTGVASPSNNLKAPGSVRVKAFVNLDLAAIYAPAAVPWPVDVTRLPATEPTDDGSTAILLSTGKLTAELSTKEVATGDDFTVSGTLEGPREVEILTVSPRGASGKGLRTAISIGWLGGMPLPLPIAIVTPYPGGTYNSVAVSSADHTFSKKLDVRDTANTGTYLVVVLSRGIDGEYGDNQGPDLPQALNKYAGDLSTKTQDQILSILEGLTTRPGSDDLMWVGYIKVETPYVTLDPIESVAVGEPLKVTGESNRKDGYAIVVTVTGPKELAPATVSVTNGTFEATFDTTDAPVGTYTVKADDGDGHSDMGTVDISLKPKPTATPEPTATAEPTTPPVPTVAPTATPEPTPTKTPGFGAVFAIAGMLAIAYLVLRKRRE